MLCGLPARLTPPSNRHGAFTAAAKPNPTTGRPKSPCLQPRHSALPRVDAKQIVYPTHSLGSIISRRLTRRPRSSLRLSQATASADAGRKFLIVAPGTVNDGLYQWLQWIRPDSHKQGQPSGVEGSQAGASFLAKFTPRTTRQTLTSTSSPSMDSTRGRQIRGHG